MSDLGAFYGPNAYVLELYEHYLDDPASVGARWQSYFAEFTPEFPASNGLTPATAATAPAAPAVDLEKVVGAASMAQAIREYGHLAANIDPLGRPVADEPDLEQANYGVTDADLRALPAMVIGGEVGSHSAKAIRN